MHWIDDLEVLDAELRTLRQDGLTGASDAGGAGFPALHQVRRLAQGPVKLWSDRTFGVAEQPVAGTHRESVWLADGRHFDHFHPNIEVRDHTANYGELLRVFLTKVDASRLHNVEKLEHHSGNAAEMAGTEMPAEVLGDRARLDKDALWLGIHYGGGWSEQEVRAVGLTEGGIDSDVAWVSLEVAGAIELNGVHEQADHKDLVLTARPVQKRSMARVERAHGGNQADFFVRPKRRPHFGYRVENAHG